MKENRYRGSCGCHTVFLQLVAALPQCLIRGMCRALYRNINRRFLLSAGFRTMGKSVAEKQSVGGRVQYGERVVHAGDPSDGKRIFHQSADQILVQKKRMERLDKCGESLQGKHDFRHAG